MIIAFTGHRPQKLGGYKDTPIKQWIREQLKSSLPKYAHQLFELNENCGLPKDDPLVFRSGGALGFDQIAAWEVGLLKKTYPDIILEMFLPHPDYGENWNAQSRMHLKYLCHSFADKVYYCSDEYLGPGTMFKRNRDMIRGAHVLIACWDGSGGGTKNTIEEAIKKIDVVRLNPKTKSTSVIRSTKAIHEGRVKQGRMF